MREYYDDIKTIVVTAVITLLLLWLTGCSMFKSTANNVPMETTRVVYQNVTDTVRDSIFHDVFHNIYVKGDTVYKEKTEYLYKWKYLAKTDTLVTIDSIPYAVTTIEKVYVEAELAWWQTTLMWLGGITLSLAFMALITIIIIKKGGGFVI